MIIWGPNGTRIWQCIPNLEGGESYTDPDEEDHLDREQYGCREADLDERDRGPSEMERFERRASETQPPPPSGSIVLSDDGNMNLYRSVWPNDLIWSSCSGFPRYAGKVSKLKPGQALLVGQSMLSRNGDHELSLLPSGNLCLHNTRFNSNVYYFIIPDSTVKDARYLSLSRNLLLEIRGADSGSIWRAKNSVHGRETYREEVPPSFILNDDAEVHVQAYGRVQWDISDLPSGPTQRQTSIGNTLRPGTKIGLEQFLRSNNGMYIARFNTKGEFILIQNGDRRPSIRGDQLW